MQAALSIIGIALVLLLSPPVVAGDVPADIYFSVAVSENSHNHYGENLLFLDFQEQAVPGSHHPGVVRSPRFKAGTLSLDGRMDDWNPKLLSVIEGRVMNNYPLSEHFDATPTPITIGSGFDGEYIYFVLQWEDANHDASVNRNRWIYNGGDWVQKKHVGAGPGTPAATVVNRDDDLAGREDEDQVFFMFPIVDNQGNFRDGSLGCGGYCHVGLADTGDPGQVHIGNGVSAMHTAISGDLADLWHWTATRSRSMNTLLDGYLDYGEDSYNGRKADAGTDPFEYNAAVAPLRPLYLSEDDFKEGNYQKTGFATQTLSRNNMMPISNEMTFAEGVSLPYYVGVPASGSRADVETAASYDVENYLWTVEFRRKRVTGDEKDYQFLPGIDAQPPVAPLVKRGDADKGEHLYREKDCSACHGERGEGSFEDGRWLFPRNQRVSGPSIRNTASPHRPKRMRNLVFQLKQEDREPPQTLMPFVQLTAQEAEDIAAWLQLQFTPRGQ